MSERNTATDESQSRDSLGSSTGWQSWRETGAEEESARSSVGVSPASDASAFRAAYGLLRGPLKRRSSRFTSLANWLAQANLNRTPGEYLARTVRRAVALAVVVAGLLGILVGGLAPRVSALAVVNEIAPPSPAVAAGIGVAGTATFVATVVGHYYYPLVRAKWRRRNIDADLPHAIVFMYVLAEAGLNLPEIIERLADSDDTYGTAAAEFQGMVVDMEQFNLDTLTALDEAKRRTPSADLAEFLDDLENVIESGGHLDTFLRNRSENQLAAARQRQENLIETVAAIVESYITVVFAGPIFLITILVTLGFVGINTLPLVNLTTYLLLPMGIVSFVLFFHLYNRPRERPLRIDVDEEDNETAVGGSAVTSYNRAKRIRSLKEFLDHPVVTVQQRPFLSLLVTVPLAAVTALTLAATGVVTPTAPAYADDPIWTTTALVVVPGLIPSFGLMLAHESERRRLWAVKRRFPEVLRGMSSASRNGIRLTNAITLAARRSEGALATHLQRLDNDIRVTGNLQGALQQFAAEVGVNRVTRVVKILTEGNRVSGSLEDVLSITAEDTQERFRLDIQWRHAMQPYVAFFMIGVLVYLFIILIFVEVFFPILADVESEVLGGAVAFGPGDGDLPLGAFEAALYHSLLVQAFGNGLVMGKLLDNSLTSGLKYANPLLVLTVVIFYVI